MNIFLYDADLIDQGDRAHYPNLALMKISAFYKDLGHNVQLKTDYAEFSPLRFDKKYDKAFIAKVFTETKVPDYVLESEGVTIGGTGFFFDKAPSLDYKIEHYMPDYTLYDDFIKNTKSKKIKKNFYTDYSFGYTTRGCIRGCKFCVLQNEKKVILHSPIDEFYDPRRKKVYLLDDNILASKDCMPIIKELVDKKIKFRYAQGMDIRLINKERAELLNKARYDGDYIFAFDNIKDYSVIERKIQLWREFVPKKHTKFYVLVGFDHNNKYDESFFIQDIMDMMKRVELLMKYNCSPYIMRHKDYENSPYKGIIINIKRWCNTPSNFKRKTFLEFIENEDINSKSKNRYNQVVRFMERHPEFSYYFNMRYEF